MKFGLHIWHVKSAAGLLLPLAACNILAQPGPGKTPTWHWKYLEGTSAIRVGDSAQVVGKNLEPPWVAVDTNIFLRMHPTSQWVPYTNLSTVLEWQSREDNDTGWPFVIFAVFSDGYHTNLTDAFLYTGGEGVSPLVDGPYNRKLHALKKGDNMEMVFRELGRRTCEYFQSKEGKWCVRATYQDCKGRVIIMEAEAGTGLILRVWDGTI